MSVSNIQQNYIQYNSNNSSAYVIQQSYPNNNTPSQHMIVSNNYNNGYQSTMVNSTQYQSYSVPQAHSISNGSYPNTAMNNQIIPPADNNNTFIKVNVNGIPTTQQEQQVYPLAPTSQPVQQIYNGQGYVQSPTIINSSNIAYQHQPPHQSHIIINNSNEIQYSLATTSETVTNSIYSSSINQDINQNVLTNATQNGMSPVVLKQSNDSNNNSDGVLPLFQKQPQQPINYSSSSVISNSSLESNNENSNTNSKSTCIYTPIQTPNTSPLKKDVIVNDNSVAQTNKINNMYPVTTLAQGKNITTNTIGESIPPKDIQSNGKNINNTQYINNENSINSITSNSEMLSPKSLSNESSNQSIASSNKIPIQNGNNNNNNIVVVNNMISPEIKEVERKINGTQDQSYIIQGQNQNQRQISQTASYHHQPNNNNQNSSIQNIPYQSPDNNYVVSTESNNVPYNTYNSYNNIVPQNVINQQYNIQQQGYYNSQPQNQTIDYQSVPMQGKPVQFISPPNNVSYIQNSVVSPMENNNVSYNSQQQIVNNQVNYSSQQINSNQQIYYNNQSPVQQVGNVGNVNMNTNYNTQFSVPYPVRSNNVISANSPPAKVKRYKCTECGKRFSRPSSLKTHMYSHTGQHPFKCTLAGCGRRFSVLSNLRRHMKVCQKRHEKNRALILRNAKLSNSKICDDDEVNTTTITIDDINSSKIRVIENKKAKNTTNKPSSSSNTSISDNVKEHSKIN
ncbi:hypothetical protein BCR36DRAFT_584786 [Piromyces finnis]|uniref:C2H2-type domain-containing protein n=1 Tax=Piromyces finnis TaxID=1754191 RepID=A0A1Y1V600_9FUNG|nr:hypothetical protein BCR36DRAFT_584786 [Piromyces finnis]|eukprot:ORX47273.1 hypothetical protein BCR36DRAFT_584786 [Piromyces finnis]